MDTSGRNPKGYSAAALYLSASHAGENKTQKETCIISQVSEVTLRARIREIKKYNIELFDN